VLNQLITILGPTASGKTSIAANLAYRLNGEIISADSRQIYKGMDIGTGKDLKDYQINGKIVPSHLIDIVEAGEKYNLFEYQKAFIKTFNEISTRGKQVILCGGTGLYIDAVVKRYDMVQVPVNESLRKELEGKSLIELAEVLQKYRSLHNKSDFDTIKRAIRAIEIAEYTKNKTIESLVWPEFSPIIFGIKYPREIERERITQRLKQRLDEGLIEEVKYLLEKGISPDDLIYYGLEYKYLMFYLQNKINKEELFNQLNTAIHQFAKRQMTWYRKMEKEGTVIHWIDGQLAMEDKLNQIINRLNK
jgi:tRNA dimethylallyltransferase